MAWPFRCHPLRCVPRCLAWEGMILFWAGGESRVRADDEGGALWFSATLQLDASTPLDARGGRFLAATLARRPFFCAWIQVLIHVEALRLWLKGAVFHPHPEGASSAASRIIETVMTPLFALQEYQARRAAKSLD